MTAPERGYNPRLVSRAQGRPGAEDAVCGLRPRSPIRGRIAVPCSKSIAQRALVLASLTGGTTRITALDPPGARGDDVERALALVEAAGARVERLAPGAVAVTGRPPGPHRGWSGDIALEAGESGTLARLATAALAFCGTAGRAREVRASGTLLGRASTPLFAALRSAGVITVPADAEGWPVSLVPIGPPSEVRLDAPVSSQEVSALAIALAAYPDATRLLVCGPIPSRPYLEMTLAMLREFGARIELSPATAGEAFDVRGPLVAPASPIAVEPDASAAAVALAAGCLSGGSVEIAGLGSRSLQGDVRVVEHLRAFGCDASAEPSLLRASGLPTRGARVDLSGEPDLAPVLAVIGALAAIDGAGPTRITGLSTLPRKESSRIEVLAEGLRAVGLGARALADELSIECPRRAPAKPSAPVVLDPRGDHRMGFAFALLGLCVEGVSVRDPSVVAKSWPAFWSAMRKAGATCIRAPT
jgi:3-phosphoshikimate 1-carboxyvinyltransferase